MKLQYFFPDNLISHLQLSSKVAQPVGVEIYHIQAEF